MTISADELLIGAHTSGAGGLHNALLEGKSIGATTIQLFTANQRQWKGRELKDEEIALWKQALEETGLRQIMSHDSYLINMGAPDPINLEKSRESFKQEIQRCTQLGITYLNFHPGAALKEDPQMCLDLICESLLLMVPQMENSPTRLLLESTAGQGSAIGWRFEELAYIINKVKGDLPIGVCIDTCHSFVAGYDLRTQETLDTFLKEFDRVVGLSHLYAFHINDSLKGLGSRVDRHAALGEGMIGIDCFKALMQDPRTRTLPKYLETPGGPPLWTKEIALLRQFGK